MWLITTRDFYSVVAHRYEPDKVLVRARSRDGLGNFRDPAEPACPSTHGLSYLKSPRRIGAEVSSQLSIVTV